MIEEDIKLIPAVYDFVFKSVLLNPKNRKFLLTLISEVTEIPISEFKNVSVMNAEHTVAHKSEKKKRSDVIVKVGNQVINLEMNWPPAGQFFPWWCTGSR